MRNNGLYRRASDAADIHAIVSVEDKFKNVLSRRNFERHEFQDRNARADHVSRSLPLYNCVIQLSRSEHKLCRLSE